jgi:hypothetical protein
MDESGYMHPAYAGSLKEFGRPLSLSRSGGWILERRIPSTDYSDAMGCYPVFACRDWSQLDADLEQAGQRLVCVSLVTDPLGEYDAAYLRECFRDVVIPFKQHFVVDLGRSLNTFVHPHHRRNARKALAAVRVEVCADPSAHLEEWYALYRILVERHGINGMAAFSRESFAGQLSVPGIVALRALAADDNETVGMLLWYEQGDAAYYHLGAYGARGYELRASFALFSHALEYFAARGLKWLNLGGGAGAAGGTSGLSRFKEGWSNAVRTAYFCGRVFDSKKYEEIVSAKGVGPTEYFPAYRLGEFR